MMRALRRSVAFWLFLAALTLFLLQWYPNTGIVLMVLGAGPVNALLIHLFLLALFIEALVGRVRPAFIVLPVLAYGGYYGAYVLQGHLVAAEKARIEARHAGKAYAFDPAAEALVFDTPKPGMPSANLQFFVATHRIPVAYDRLRAARLAPAAACAGLRNLQNGAAVLVTPARWFYHFASVNAANAPCVLTRVERPAGPVVVLREEDRASPALRLLGISENSTDVFVDGKRMGSLTRVVVRRMLPFVSFVGCVLIDEPPAWVCTNGMFGSRTQVAGPPPTDMGDDAGVLLGIPLYTAADILAFGGYRENDAVVKRAQLPPGR